MGLPGTGTVTGKVAWGAGAVAVTAVCIWQAVRVVGPGGMRTMPCLVVCAECGEVEFEHPVPLRGDGTPALPVKCSSCGAEAAYLCYYCPACGKPLAVDPAKPPTRCEHCRVDLKGMFDRPPAEAEP